MNSWHAYPSIYNLGHKAIAEIFLDPVIVEEKVDGSQFSFGKFLDADGHEYIRCRSRGAEINMFAPDGLFKKAVEVVQTLDLHVGWTYRAEYLVKPKHNSLCYDRVPKNHLIIFDINTGEEEYLPYLEKMREAQRLGLETVRRLHEGLVVDINMFRKLLEYESILGGQKIEGVVVKNYARFGLDKKVLLGKFVSEHFKEVHKKEWKISNPLSSDIIAQLINEYKTPARWQKAVQHLREAGQITDTPQDIGLLIPEVVQDIKKECVEEIKEKLFTWAWSKLQRGVTAGLPEWYKEELLKLQFKDTK